jgi:hypothetical protein
MEDADYNKAKKIVEIKISFFIHAGIYILVNTLLIIINLNTNPGILWFKWPLMGWGIGLFIHGIVTFISLGLNGIKEKMVEKEIQKQNKKSK